MTDCRNATPYRAGIYADNTKDNNSGILRLSLNESPYGMCMPAREALKEEVDRASYYPDSNYSDLTAEISKLHGIDPPMLLLTNGADEALLLSALAFGSGKTIVTCASTFQGYAAAARAVRSNCIEVTLDHNRVSVEKMMESITPDTALLYLCNPHNPTGTMVAGNELAALARECTKRGVVLLVDEAYAEYVTDSRYKSAVELINENSLIVIRTFSKIYGLAGLRCGYAMASRRLIQRMSAPRYVLPFNINRAASKAALCSVKSQDFIRDVRQKNAMVINMFCSRLSELTIDYIESTANFVTLRLNTDSVQVCNSLHEIYHILVRDLSEFDLNNHIRVSMGTFQDMSYFLDCIKKILEKD